PVVDDVFGSLDTEVDDSPGLVHGGLERVGPADLAQHAVELLVTLAPGHGAQVVPEGEAQNEPELELHGCFLPQADDQHPLGTLGSWATAGSSPSARKRAACAHSRGRSTTSRAGWACPRARC